MTCIVSLKEKNGAVWMGADSATCYEYETVQEKEDKIFIVEVGYFKFLIGIAGQARATNLVRYNLKIPTINTPDIFQYIAVDFVPALRACFLKNGMAEKKHNVEYHESVLLVAVKSRVFVIESDYTILEPSTEYYAIGCGAAWAMGRMYKTNETPKKRIGMALEASAFNCNYVREPFVIKKLLP